MSRPNQKNRTRFTFPAAAMIAVCCLLAMPPASAARASINNPSGKPPVLLVLPSPHAKNIAPTSTISAAIDTRSGLPLKDLNLKVTREGQPVPGQIKRDMLHSVLTFTPFTSLKPHAPFQVQVEHLHRDNGGQYRIIPVFSWSFTTTGPPTKTTAAPEPAPAASTERGTRIIELPPSSAPEEPAPLDEQADHVRISKRLEELIESRNIREKHSESPVGDQVVQRAAADTGGEDGTQTAISRRLTELLNTLENRDEPDGQLLEQPSIQPTPPHVVQDAGKPVEPQTVETSAPPAARTGEDALERDIKRLADIISGGSEPPGAGSISKRTPYWDPSVVVERDVLDIKVWNHPELSDQYNVSPTGYMAFPLVGELKVAGKTVEQVKEILTKRLARDYIKNPFVTIYHRRGQKVRVNVLGKVKRPGIFTFKEPPTILEAVAAAGGTSSGSKQEVGTVQLVRSCSKEDIDLHSILVEGRFEDNIFLEDRDILIFKAELLRERIYVFGSMLKEQGIFKYQDGMTVMDAILLAGGGTTPAELYEQFRPGLRSTQVVRGSMDHPEIKRINMERMLFRGDFSQNIKLRPGDIVIVPTKRVMDIWAFVKRLTPLFNSIIAGDKVVRIFEGETVY